MISFAGRWITSFGLMDLLQEGERVHGSYETPSGPCPLEGRVEGDRLIFRYEEPREQGEGWFELRRYGEFVGRYRPEGHEGWQEWRGNRAWDGIWDSSFGRLRLIQEADRIHGFYEGAGRSTLEGRLEGERLVFRYREPAVGGEGWFDMAEDVRSFAGAWRQEGREAWLPWAGRRVSPTPGLTWLIVLEAHWQRSFVDREYSFGGMLREFFARLAHVEVRHRIFNDEASLERWCRELLYFAEPAIVMIASHGTAEGLSVAGRSINTTLVLDYLRHASNIKLLHFSSCLVLKGEDNFRHVAPAAAFPISGYTTSVDWGGSAVIEFNYLDMILSKGRTPEEAAALLPRLVRYAGDEELPGSPYEAAGFRFLPATAGR